MVSLVHWPTTKTCTLYNTQYVSTSIRRACTFLSSGRKSELSDALDFPAIMYKDRDLDQLLKEKGLTPNVQGESGNGGGTVLLTGCTGFLGHHILLELLNSDLCGRVYCHVRGRDEGVWVRACV